MIDFDRLYRDYGGLLCETLRRKFGGGPPDPEDAAQSAFAKLASLEEPSKISNPRAFLFTTARNLILDHKRRENSYQRYSESVLAAQTGLRRDDLTPEQFVLEKERLGIVRSAIESLPYKQKVVLSLSRRQGYTYMQIVEKTGWSYGDVHRQMSYALAALSDALRRK